MLEAADMTAVPSSVLSPNNGVGTGLNAWFWRDTNFQGNPDEQRIARQVNYDVGILSTLDTPGPSQVPPPPVSCPTCPGSAVYEGHITAPKTGAYTLALTGMGDATLDIDGQRVATMNGANGTRAYAETPTLNWVEGQRHTLRVTFRGIHPFEILNDGTVLLEWRTPAGAYSPAIQRAVAAARNSDVAIVYGNTIEGEAHDRLSLKLPQSADQLIEAVSAVNPKTIVVLATAGPVSMPWLDDVEAVVQTYFGGQAQGAALARVLWGDVNPSGKLTMTYPTGEDDLPPGIESPYAGADDVDVVYGEGVNVGYKGYRAAGITPLFPFGYGLSYTRFSYSDLRVNARNPATTPIRVRFRITNTGKRDGDEVAQVYVRLPSPTREQKRLVGYSRVSTQAGRSTMVEVTIDPQASTHPLGYFDTASESWRIAPGTYRVYVGASSSRTPLRATFTVG
jgi:beta-glucosidase